MLQSKITTADVQEGKGAEERAARLGRLEAKTAVQDLQRRPQQRSEGEALQVWVV